MGKRQHKVLKLYEESWPKFEQVTKKGPTPRILNFKPSMDNPLLICFDVFCHIKRSWLYDYIMQKKSKVDYSSKIKSLNFYCF